jgi:N6-adenosine-specific RNA methylase IME4
MVLARVIVADPPWQFGDKIQGKKRGAEKHYTVMSVNDILRMPLPPIHDDATLFLWRVSSQVEEAYQVVRVWGFVPKSEIVWNKTTGGDADEDDQKDAMGMGHIVRGSHETCIVATRGRPPKPSSLRERTSFRAPRGKHSEKPEEFYRIVERLYPLELWPEAHVELFARRRRSRWIQEGLELPPPTSCLLHGTYAGDHCAACSVTGASAELQTLLARRAELDGWRRARWEAVTKQVAKDAAVEARRRARSSAAHP